LWAAVLDEHPSCIPVQLAQENFVPMQLVPRFFISFRYNTSALPPLILLDYDGVIADSYDVYFQEFTRACSEFGFHKLNSQEAFLRLFDGNLIAQLIKAGFPMRKLKKLADEFKPQIEAANARISPFPGVVETLELLSARYPVMIITANASYVVQQFLDKNNLHLIRGVVGSDIETSKVKKIRMARKKFPGHAAYYLGDTKGDMLEARRAGAIPIAAGWGWHSHERLATARPFHILASQEDMIPFFEFVMPPC
jgi:phosphoglycolate phosphatase